MIDTRNSYRIKQHNYYPDLWAAEYRPFWWPFYIYIRWDSKELATQVCKDHAAESNIEYLGKLP